MKKSLATCVILTVTGGLSLCDSCGASTRAATGTAVPVSASVVASTSAAVPTQANRRVTAIRAVRYSASRPR